MKLLELVDVTKHYENKKGVFISKKEIIKAVSNVSFSIDKQETLGIVGESGCGKSTTGRCILGLHPVTSGQVLYNGVDITKLSDKELLPYRRQMQMIFQNANSAFDPRWTIDQSLQEAIKLHYPTLTQSEVNEKIDNLMAEVGFNPDSKSKYPHEFSGGQRQRLGIAKAISLDPDFIVCDEPVSALDVSVQAQVLNLMKKLQKERKLSYLFISHDLSVIRFISDRVGVMYGGRLVELAETESFFTNPLHPYSSLLMSVIPRPQVVEDKDSLYEKVGQIAPFAKEGCPYSTRCEKVMDICKSEIPTLKEHSPNHSVACHLYK